MDVPVLLEEFDTTFAEAHIYDKIVVITAKRPLTRIDLRRYDNTNTIKPTMVKEVPILVDDCRAEVYKGDVVNINTAKQMDEIMSFNRICNGVEFHVVLMPEKNSGQMPERFVIGCEDEACRDYSFRHDDPQTMAEMTAEPLSPLSPKGGMARQISPMSNGSGGDGLGLSAHMNRQISPYSSGNSNNSTASGGSSTGSAHSGPRMSRRGSCPGALTGESSPASPKGTAERRRSSISGENSPASFTRNGSFD